MRKTKIICTLGPSSQTVPTIKALIKAGMSCGRVNMSHGSFEEHQVKIDIVKKLRKEMGIALPIMVDTKGPEMRIGMFKDDKKVALKDGQTFTFTTRDVEGDETCVSVQYKNLVKYIKPGDRILAVNGLLQFKVKEVKGTEIICKVIAGGLLGSKKTLNIPGVKNDRPFLSEADKADLLYAIRNDAEFIAASFVSCAQDVIDMQNFLRENGGNQKIIAKIENQEGIDNLQEILDVAYGVMVARGDMGVEIDYAKLPEIQKMMIKEAVKRGKVVITATEMLESMINNPRPTRAEVSDVANAIYDGTCAIMLSGESANGKYPDKAVAVMNALGLQTEAHINYLKRFRAKEYKCQKIADSVTYAAVNSAFALNSKAIITVTNSGDTANMCSKFKPTMDIVALTENEKTFHTLGLSYGVKPVLTKLSSDLDETTAIIKKYAKENYSGKKEGTVVVVMGEADKAGADTLKILNI